MTKIGAIDAKAKKYVSRPAVFADLFNYLIYHGDEVLIPDNLFEMDTAEISIPYEKNGKSYPVQKYRDVLKEAST